MRVFLAGEGCWDLKCSGFSGGVVRRLLFAYCFWLFVRFAIFRSFSSVNANERKSNQNQD